MTQVEPDRAHGPRRALRALHSRGPDQPARARRLPRDARRPAARPRWRTRGPRTSSRSGATPRTTASPPATSSAARSARSRRSSATSRGRRRPSTPTSSRWSGASSTSPTWPPTTSTAPSAARASCAARTPCSPATSTGSAPARSTSSRRCARSPSTAGCTSRPGGPGTSAPTCAPTSRCSARRRSARSTVRDWAEGLDLPIGGETVLFVDCEAAFYRTSVPRAVAQMLQPAGYEFGLMGDQWCCGGPAAEMGYVEQAQRFARHNLDDWRATGTRRVLVLDPHDYISFTEDYPKYFGEEFDIEVVLVLEVLARAAARGPAHPERAGRPSDHLSRPVPAQQAQGHLGRAPRDAAGDPRAAVPRRRPGDPVVLLLRWRRRAADREARADGEDQRAAAGAGRRARRRHAGQRLPLVGAAARRGRRRRRTSTSSTCTSCFAESLGIAVGGSRGDSATAGWPRSAPASRAGPPDARRRCAGGDGGRLRRTSAAAAAGGTE